MWSGKDIVLAGTRDAWLSREEMASVESSGAILALACAMDQKAALKSARDQVHSSRALGLMDEVR